MLETTGAVRLNSSQEITVVMPVLNEAAHIAKTVGSLLDMEAPPGCTLRFLLVDGGSNDGTREIVSEYAKEFPSITLLDNPRRKTPAAMNLGVAAARGEYVCILGAHARYPRDYIRLCWEELHAHGAAGCSGTLVTSPGGTTLGAQLAAWCMGHRFASSGGSVRTSRGGYVNTIPYPLMRKSVLTEAGGYNEKLERNQDNDMNQRICAAGHKLYLSSRTQAEYCAPAGLGALLLYAFRTGQWNAITLRYRPAAMSFRHFAPLAFVSALAVLALGAIAATIFAGPAGVMLWAIAILLGLHVTGGTVAGVETALRERRFSALLLPPVILAFHVAYGAGSFAGLFVSMQRDAETQSGAGAGTLQSSSDLPAGVVTRGEQARAKQ
jgi:succinoglycan biosynthesis protein ExoA